VARIIAAITHGNTGGKYLDKINNINASIFQDEMARYGITANNNALARGQK